MSASRMPATAQLSGAACWAPRVLWTAGLAGMVVFSTAALGGPGDSRGSTYQALFVGVCLIAGALCLLRALMVADGRLTWAALGIAIVSWSAGEGYWLAVVQDMPNPPYPSWADVLWLGYYGASFFGLVTLMRAELTRARKALWIDVAVGALALATIGAALLFRPITDSTGGNLSAVATNLAYPLFDVLIVSLVLAVFVINNGRPGRVWMILGVLWVMQAVVDSFFLHQVASGTYVAGGLLDACWHPLMLLAALAAWQRPAPAPPRAWVQGPGALAVTIGFAAVGLFVLTYDHWHAVDGVAVVLATLTLLCAFVRAAMMFAGMTGLARSRELLVAHQMILNAAGDGIVGVDENGLVTFANPAAAGMVGYGSQELIGADLHSKLHHTRPDGTAYPRADCPVLASLIDGSIHRCDRDVYWRKDGTSFAVSYTSTPIFEGSRKTGAVVVFRDITARREMERAKDQFTSIVSHELRTPLTSIRASLGLLESGALGPLPGDSRRMLQIAVRNTDRLVRLINDLLDLGRFDADAIQLLRTPCDAAELIARATEAVLPLASDTGVTFEVDAGVTWEGDARAALFTADPDRLIQVLTNLISNAVKFSAPAGTVRIRAVCGGDGARFTVSDDGSGIPAHKLETIFGRFEQVDASDSRRKGGTGLGLAICRSIVEHHGGVIWAESPAGCGTTLTFLIPAEPGDPTSPDTKPDTETAHEPQAHPARR